MTEDGNRKISKIWYSVNTANPKSRRVNMGWCFATMFLSGQSHFDFRPSGDEIPNNATTPTVMYYCQQRILLM